MIIILIVVISQNRFFAPFLFTSTHVSAFHNFSELKCVFFLFMIVGINSNSCRNWKVHERKTKNIETEWGNNIRENESTGFHTQFYDSYKRSPHAKRYVTLSCWTKIYILLMYNNSSIILFTYLIRLCTYFIYMKIEIFSGCEFTDLEMQNHQFYNYLD